jgi:hypothetical protein
VCVDSDRRRYVSAFRDFLCAHGEHRTCEHRRGFHSLIALFGFRPAKAWKTPGLFNQTTPLGVMGGMGGTPPQPPHNRRTLEKHGLSEDRRNRRTLTAAISIRFMISIR